MARKTPILIRTYLYDGEEASPSPVVSYGGSTLFIDRFACPHCNVRQQSLAALRNHIRVHTGERPFKCDMCVKSFKMPHHLLDHTRTHNGEKPYCCQHCDKKFVQRSNLRQHEKTVHFDEKHYPCRYCTERFSNEEELNDHQLIHSQHEFFTPGKTPRKVSVDSRIEPYVCRYCPLRFHCKESMDVHVRLHLFEKQYLPAPATSPGLLPRNLVGISSKVILPLHTETVDQKFVPKLEMTTLDSYSSMSRNYKCEHCPRAFARRSALKIHMDRVHQRIYGEAQNQSFREHDQIHKITNRFIPRQKRHCNNNCQVFSVSQKSRIRSEPTPFYCNNKSYIHEVAARDFQEIHLSNIEENSVNCEFCFNEFSRTIGSIYITCGHCKEPKKEGKTLHVIESEVKISSILVDPLKNTLCALQHEENVESENTADTEVTNLQKSSRVDQNLILGL